MLVATRSNTATAANFPDGTTQEARLCQQRRADYVMLCRFAIGKSGMGIGLVLCLISVCSLHPMLTQNGSRMPHACPVSPDTPVLADATTLSDYAHAILEFLSAGGRPSVLQQVLIARRLAQPYASEERGPINPYFLNRGGVRTADFNGDGYLDVAVSLWDPANNYGGALFVYVCDGQHFREIPSPLTVIIDPNTNQPKLIDKAPKFIFVGDMINNGRAQLVFDIGVTGASTNWMDVQIVAWNDQTRDMRPIKADQDAYPADSGYYKVVNATQGRKALVIRTGFSGSSVAAGPQRQFTLTYVWDGQQFVIAEAVGDPTTSRLHVAYDALVALNHREFKTAVILYNRVLHDSGLDDWDNDFGMRHLLMAHAAFALVLTRAEQFGLRADSTLTAYQQLQKLNAQLSTENILWFTYAAVFWQTAQKTTNLHTACQAVNITIQADIAALPAGIPHDVRALGIWPWFTYNVNWIPTDRDLSFCPL